jgi:O-antigen/teichoic acid export membrane protein
MSNKFDPMSIFRNSSLVLAGNALSAAMGFAVLALLTRGLDPAAFGTFATLMTVIDIGLVVIDAMLFAGVVIVAARHAATDPVRSDMALKLGLLIRLPVVAVIALAGVLGADAIARLLTGSPEWAQEVRIAFLALPLLALQSYALSTMQARQAFGRLALTTLYKNLFRLGAVGVLFVLGALTVRSAVSALLVAAALALALALVSAPWAYLRRPGLGQGVLREIFDINKWMALAALGLLGARFDIVMLSRLSTPEQAGYYAAALQLCLVMTLVSTALVTTLLPKTAQLATQEDMRRHFRRCLPYLPLGLAGFAAVFAVSGWAVPLALGPNFAGAVAAFDLLTASAMLTMVTNPLLLLFFPMGLVASYAAMTFAQLLLRVAANWFVIPVYGAAGAAAVDLGVKALTIAIAGCALWWALERRRTAAALPMGGSG